MEKLLQDVTKAKFLYICESLNVSWKINILEINRFSYNYLIDFLKYLLVA